MKFNSEESFPDALNRWKKENKNELDMFDQLPNGFKRHIYSMSRMMEEFYKENGEEYEVLYEKARKLIFEQRETIKAARLFGQAEEYVKHLDAISALEKRNKALKAGPLAAGAAMRKKGKAWRDWVRNMVDGFFGSNDSHGWRMKNNEIARIIYSRQPDKKNFHKYSSVLREVEKLAAQHRRKNSSPSN